MSAPPKARLDQVLLDRGFFPTRNQAQAAVLAGEIFSGDRLMAKPGQPVRTDIPLAVRPRKPKFVSRGGYKMEGALLDFKLDVEGLACLDIGSSTGGFTDCLLQHGAARVCCVDVGKGQLEYRLRQDPRVQVMEGVNARYLLPEDVPGPFDLAVADVSFISIKKILPVAAALLAASGRVLALIKPQFEVGPSAIGKGGVVKDKQAREEAVARVVQSLSEAGLRKLGVKPSVLKGMDGNVEYFLLAERET